MAKIVFMSDSPTINTGYGRVAREVTTALHNAGHDLLVIGWGAHHSNKEVDLPFPLIPVKTHEENYGEEALAQIVREEQPDIVFTLGDPWMTEWIPHMEERSAFRWLSYFPIDGHPIPPQWHSWVKDADVPIVFSKYAYNLVKQITKDVVYIPHGVDTEVFKPLDTQKEIKSNVLGRDDLFVVGCVARNQPRKNLPALIKAFAKFSRNKEDVALYLHTQIRDVGWNIDELVTGFGLTEKAYSTSGFSALHGVSDASLNELYNMFDVMALPTMAEGFGLPILESQSAGTPVLVTDFSACSELTVNRQELIKVKDTLIMGRGIEQAIADTDDLANKLGFFYNDWKRQSKRLTELGAEGRKKAESMDWRDVNGEFIKLIGKVEELGELDKTIRPKFYRI